MRQGKHSQRIICLSMLFGLFVWTTACASPPQALSSPTSTARATVALPTATAQPGIQPLNISGPAAPGMLLPSPDGTLIASLNSFQTTVSIYDLTGQEQGQYTAPAGQGLTIAWLPDSSALFAWEGSGTGSGSLFIVDHHGNAQPLGINAGAPVLSPDGQWVAATQFTDSIQQDVAEVVPRTGGQARILAQGADVLGWRGNQIVYWADGSLYAVAPMGGSPHLLIQVPEGEYLRPLGILGLAVESPVSPDGQVLIVDGQQDRYWMLAGTQLQRLPSTTYQALPVFWVGPHDGLGLAGGGDLVFLDLISGTVVSDIGVSLPNFTVQAVAGVWLAGTTLNQPGLLILNDATKAQVTLETLPISPGSGKVVPLGATRFLVYDQQQGGGEVYIVDPATAAGG